MLIRNAFILAAGKGTRLKPLTNTNPKPLLIINNKTLLERTINFLKSCGINNIIINTYYLSEKIKSFLNKKNFGVKILISDEKEMLLDTGGGLKNIIKNFNKEPFLTINPDTVWGNNYQEEFIKMTKIFNKQKKPILMVVNKVLSKEIFSGDFNMDHNNVITRGKDNKFIFTGMQLMKEDMIPEIDKKIFSMNLIWDKLIERKDLLGFESEKEFLHINTTEAFERIQKLNIN